MRIFRLTALIAILVLIIGVFKQVFAEGSDVQKDKEKAMSVKLQWFGHASFKITNGSDVIYIDPWKLKDTPHDATIVLVSHSHYDHYSAGDIAKVSGITTKFIAAEDVIKKQGKGQVLKPGQTIDVNGIKITGVPMYNPAKQFHPKSNNWVGFVIEISGKRIYYAGDTDETPEMDAQKNIDLALLPVGGTYTMSAAEAAEATKQFKPKHAIPYHWGDIVGSQADADKFAKSAACPVKILKKGDTIDVE
jgi:L-ascorbate metabolism protein UlaG (beta-lactamase superfamily)